IKKRGNIVGWVRRAAVIDPSEFMIFHDNELTEDEILKLVQKPFDLENNLLGHMHIIRLNNGQYRIIKILHHILIDGLSCKATYDVMELYYNNTAYFNPVSIEEQEYLHHKLASDLNQILIDNKSVMQDFWKKHLKGISGPDLKFLKSNISAEAALSRNVISELRFSFNEETFVRVRQLTRGYRLTPYIFGQLIFGILIYKMNGQDTLGVSFPTAILEGKELIFGAHINSIVLPFRFNDNTSIQNLVDDILAFYGELKNTKAKYLPVHELLKFAESGGLMDIGFVQTDLKDNAVAYDDTEHIEIRNDLNIDVSNSLIFEQEVRDNQINYRVRYNNRELNASLINNFVTLYQQLFNDILDDLVQSISDKKIANYKLLHEREISSIMAEQSGNQRSYPKQKTIHCLFEEQVERTPNAIALVYEGVRLTYLELNNKANRVAAFLRKTYQIVPDDLVALCLDRSEHMIIAILAVLKAGGAYVPVDPKYPQERIRFILQDTHARIMLSNEAHYERSKQAANDLDLMIECIDSSSFESAVARLSADNLVTECLPANLFYIVYTSGTTDNPKGVMIEHRHIIPVIDAIREAYNFEDVAKISAFTSFGFDVSSSEFFISLLYGNELHLLSEKLRTDVKELSKYILTNEIEYVYLPPVVLSALPKIDYKHLKSIIYAGEPCDFETGKYWSGIKRLYNYYGPSETNIATGKLIIDGDIHLIGKAVYNATVYVLDKNGDNLPAGATGELYIGGDAVARGYLNLPELTNSRFISNPFQSVEDKAMEKNSRLYKTGDLVRFLPDGNLEYLGRNDFQVKIRGYRVELAEIEARLTLYPHIKQAIVLALQHSATNTKYLAGYYVSNELIDHELILSYLGNHLPEYMVPAVLVHLRDLPHTINGKVDRKALPDPGFTGNTTYNAPQNETQLILCKVYAEILELESSEISIDDNFFRLGGNSIAAIKLISKLDEVFGKTIKVAAVYSCKTVRKLSDLLLADLIARVNIATVEEDTGILSFAQERLLFLDLYEGGSYAYNIPVAFKLSGTANAGSFISGLRSIVNRHEVLRSVIKTDENGNSIQEVQDDALLPLNAEPVNISSKRELDEAIDKLFCHTFRLNEEYPIKVQVYHVNLENQISETYVGLVIHHIAFDGWSADIMMRELKSFYRYFESERVGESLLSETSFPNPLALQYRDFAAWQRGFLVGDVWSAQLSYWKNKLSGCVPLLLPTDKKRPSKTNYEGADVHFELDSDTSFKLRQVSKSLEVSMYSLLLSAYYLLLKGYANQDDIVIGTPVANRHYAQLQNTIGFFANTLAIRQLINPEITITDFIQEVSESVIEAQTHQDLPFEKLVSELGLQHDASMHPVFQVMFGVQNFGLAKQDVENDLFSIYHTEASYNRKPAKFDLTTMLNDGGERISGSFNYATSIFDETSICAYAETYKIILQQIASIGGDSEKGNIKLSAINYFDEATSNKILHKWNATEQAYPSDKTIHRLFEEQAERTPDNIAVIYEDTQLTYKQLNARSNQLAAYLKDTYAIRTDELLALCLERSENMLITILAVLKTGGAYVPIDSSLPKERIAYILEDTKARLVLTDEANWFKIQECRYDGLNVECVYGGMHNHKISEYPKVNISSHTGPHDLAYVTYTSGTTGKPKGVMLQHQGIVNTIVWMNKHSPLRETDRLLQKVPYAFDVSIMELFWPVWYGAAVVFARPEGHKDVTYLIDIIQKAGITSINFVSSMLSPFQEALQSADFKQKDLSSLRYLFCGGEPLTLQQVKKTHDLMPHAAIKNVYGPTEASINLLHYDCSSKDIQTILIGRPASNTKIYILDDQLRPLPVGAIGELYLCGDGIARGYLNLPELTRESFIENPFQTSAEKAVNRYGRLYKTGDLVRYLPNGDVEFFGRNDFQVKINGYRMELGEIEIQLVSFPGVTQAIVLARENKFTQAKYLAGYYTSEQTINEEALQAHLGVQLPEYMVPSVFVAMDEFPFTVNGKIDRKALPEPEFTSNNSYTAPENEMQAQVTSLFANILGLDALTIGIDDDFFKLGGNSIRSMHLLHRINSRLGSNIKVTDIFLSRTIRAICTKIENALEENKLVVKLNNTTDKTNLFMIHPGMSGCEVYIPLAHEIAGHFSCYGIDSYNLYNNKKIENLTELATYYLSFIDEIHKSTQQEPIVLLGWSLGGLIALEIAALLEKRGVKNSIVYALDTLINDDFVKKLSISQGETEMEELFKAAGLMPADYQQHKDLYHTESRMMNQPVSKKLEYTKVTLFKAMLFDGESKSANRNLFVNYLKNKPDNNMASVLHSAEQLQVLQMPESNHWNILKDELRLKAAICNSPW
ncbi:MAG: hypothetical protein JWQ25_3189, partial [Daejeonella sp.]|nr:hypothetical protein [Daejeonella sp.]